VPGATSWRQRPSTTSGCSGAPTSPPSSPPGERAGHIDALWERPEALPVTAALARELRAVRSIAARYRLLLERADRWLALTVQAAV
jgi:hypothetical protein